MIEVQLETLSGECILVEQETDRVDLLEKKKLWVLHELQNKHVNSLFDSSELLKNQLQESQQQLVSFQNNVTIDDAETPLMLT